MNDTIAAPTSVKTQAAEQVLKQDLQTASLTPEEKKKVEELKTGINFGDQQVALYYGVNVQKSVSAFADSILGEVRNKDSGAVGGLLTDLIQNVRGMDVDTLSGRNKNVVSRFLNLFMDQAQRFVAQYEKLGGQIDRITDKLDQAQMQLVRDLVMLDNLFEKNTAMFRELNLHILAGEEKLSEAQAKDIPAAEAKAASGDMTDQQALSDLRQSLNRFDKRIHDLKLTRMIVLQTLPQIRIVQNNNHELVTKIQSSVLNTIPLWKNQIVVAISLYRQGEAAKLQKSVSDTTNDLLKKNAELLKQNAVDVARESERGIVDVETLRKVNSDLISTIEETLQIQEQGRQKRVAVEKELGEIESQLKSKLVSLKA